MIELIILLIPIVALGLYIKREQNTQAMIKAGIVLVLIIASTMFFQNTKGTDTKSLMLMFVGMVGMLGSYIYAIILGLGKGRKGSLKLSKQQKTEVFTFSAGRKDLTIANPFRGVLIVGGAGSGKSRTFMYPIIKQCAEKNYTGVLYDFKSPELMSLAEQCYKHYDSPVRTAKIDFKNPSNSQRANPLAYVESAIHATNYSQAFILNLMPEYIQKQDFWSRSMLSIFSGTIWYFKKNAPHLATLPHIFAFFFTANAKEIVQILSTDNEIKGYISSLAEAVEQGAEKQVAGVLGTLKNAIGIYNTPDIFWLLSADETNLNVNDPKDPTMLLIGNNSTLADTYAPLCSLLITVCSKLMNEPNKMKSAIIVDESPTIYLPNFEQIPATARSNKVAVIVGAQDISQMNDKYGRDKTEVLVSNLGNQFYGRTTNKETAQRVVTMFGQREDIVETKGKSGGVIGDAVGMYGKRSVNQSIQKRDRIKIQQMTTLNAGQFAGILAEGKNKEFLEQIDLQKMPNFEVQKTDNGYSLSSATSHFDSVYRQVKTFLGKRETISDKIEKRHKKKGFGRITDLDL